MLPFTPQDLDKLLQRMTVLEMNINRLEVKMEVNAGNENDTTLSVLTLTMTQNT